MARTTSLEKKKGIGKKALSNRCLGREGVRKMVGNGGRLGARSDEENCKRGKGGTNKRRRLSLVKKKKWEGQFYYANGTPRASTKSLKRGGLGCGKGGTSLMEKH